MKDLFGLLEGDAVRSIKSLTEHVRERFFKFLCNGFVHCGLYVAPPSTIGTTCGTNNMHIRRIWNSEFVAAALLAAEVMWICSAIVSESGLMLSVIGLQPNRTLF